MSDAGDLLKRMADAYAALRTYADRSTVLRVSRSDVERSVQRDAGRLHFERPGRLRFESGESVVWAQGNRARWLRAGSLVSDSLQSAILRVMGTAVGSAAFEPARLLMPSEFPGIGLARLERPVLQGEASIDGVRCRRLAGRQEEAELTLWIDAEALLIRQVQERRRIGPARWRLEAEAIMAHLRAVPSIPERWTRLPLPARPPERLEIETTASVAPEVDRPLDPALFKPHRPTA
jgi:hypothetical protein